jgi:dinuclear metal center YbgI/SA1388 family protein
MVTVGDLCAHLERFAPLSLQESYDNAGLIVGRRDQRIEGILICLDVTTEVIAEALQLGCNTIVSHHPLLFRPLKRVNGSSHTERCLVEAIKNDIAIYAGHTNVDAVRGGVNERMADKLGLLNRSILVPGPSKEVENGLGMIGDLPEPLSENDFLERVKQTFGCAMVRCSRLRNRPIRTVALCGGSGSGFLKDALERGADVFLTGEAKYHEFSEYASEILLVDAGHYETEQFTKDVFFEVISKILPTFAVRISTVETNSVQYV